MKTLLAVLLTLGLSTSAFASEEVVFAGGGISNLSIASQVVGLAVVGLFVKAAIDSNPYTCVIVKTAPKPGTNYSNEKSICTES